MCDPPIQSYFRYQRWRVALWQNLENCLSIIRMVDAIHFHSVSCFVSHMRLHQYIEVASREWQYKSNNSLQNHFSSWDGETFKTEAPTVFTHYLAMSLGSYRDSPFVTGSSAYGSVAQDGLETEILDYASGTWVQAEDYPFSRNDRYVLEKCKIIFHIWTHDQIFAQNYVHWSSHK